MTKTQATARVIAAKKFLATKKIAGFAALASSDLNGEKDYGVSFRIAGAPFTASQFTSKSVDGMLDYIAKRHKRIFSAK